MMTRCCFWKILTAGGLQGRAVQTVRRDRGPRLVRRASDRDTAALSPAASVQGSRFEEHKIMAFGRTCSVQHAERSRSCYAPISKLHWQLASFAFSVGTNTKIVFVRFIRACHRESHSKMLTRNSEDLLERERFDI